MYPLATKCTSKNEVRNAIRVYGLTLHATIGVENARLCQQWQTVQWSVQHFSRGVRTADVSVCGRRSAVIVGSTDWQRTDFLFRGRDVAITMNSVKILHAVRSGITAITELIVF